MPSPTELLRHYNIRPSKRLGQCFLHDRRVVERIILAADVDQQDVVIEIGAGLGILTEALIETGAHLVAIEKDPTLAEILRERLAIQDRLELVTMDALEFMLVPYLQARKAVKAKVLGNLPYNVSTPLIFHILSQRASVSSITVMLQKEVAERLCAKANTKAYGAPTVICQQYAEVEYCFSVGRGAFTPVPQVDSAVVKLTIRPKPLADVDEQIFSAVVKAAFGQRRKTLQRALESRFSRDTVKAALSQIGLDGRRRGETLTITEFGELGDTLHKLTH